MAPEKKLLSNRNGKYLNVNPNIYAPTIGDDIEFNPSTLVDTAKDVIIWGAHKFGHLLPKGSLLVWDKVPTGKLRDQGDGEAAWINRDQPLRIFRLLWDGLCVGEGARHEVTRGQKRYHPNQKPEALMLWCLSFIPDASSVLDPYCGSGSTGVACVKLGRRFVGIELDEKYFNIACERIAKAYQQPRLFEEPAPKPKQDALL